MPDPVGPKIESQVLNDNFAELDSKDTQIESDLTSHLAETASDGVHGMGSIASEEYEEGVFSVALIGSTVEGSATYNSTSGRYIRMGNVVYIQAGLILTSKGGLEGDVMITGLPYASRSSGASGRFSLAVGAAGNFSTGDKPITARVQHNATHIRLSVMDGTVSESILNDTQINDTFNIYLSGFYQID